MDVLWAHLSQTGIALEKEGQTIVKESFSSLAVLCKIDMAII